jgi:hypothetical protein
VVHPIYEKCLRVGHVACHMEREVLPATIGQQVIARNHARQYDGGHARLVALSNQILI